MPKRGRGVLDAQHFVLFVIEQVAPEVVHDLAKLLPAFHDLAAWGSVPFGDDESAPPPYLDCWHDLKAAQKHDKRISGFAGRLRRWQARWRLQTPPNDHWVLDVALTTLSAWDASGPGKQFIRPFERYGRVRVEREGGTIEQVRGPLGPKANEGEGVVGEPRAQVKRAEGWGYRVKIKYLDSLTEDWQGLPRPNRVRKSPWHALDARDTALIVRLVKHLVLGQPDPNPGALAHWAAEAHLVF